MKKPSYESKTHHSQNAPAGEPTDNVTADDISFHSHPRSTQCDVTKIFEDY